MHKGRVVAEVETGSHKENQGKMPADGREHLSSRLDRQVQCDQVAEGLAIEIVNEPKPECYIRGQKRGCNLGPS